MEWPKFSTKASNDRQMMGMMLGLVKSFEMVEGFLDGRLGGRVMWLELDDGKCASILRTDPTSPAGPATTLILKFILTSGTLIGIFLANEDLATKQLRSGSAFIET